MTIEQTVEIPPSRRLTIEVPREIPAGTAVKAEYSASWKKTLAVLKRTQGIGIILAYHAPAAPSGKKRRNSGLYPPCKIVLYVLYSTPMQGITVSVRDVLAN
jgi:hypothetical protein